MRLCPSCPHCGTHTLPPLLLHDPSFSPACRFVAGLIFACPAVDIAIYSTCKRISQKLLRNVCKFLELIYLEMKVPGFPVVRKNQEELHIQGPEGVSDVRTCSSYPSKVHP